MYNDGSLVTLHTFNHSRNLGVEIGPYTPISNWGFVFWGNSTGWIGWSSTDPPSSSHPRIETDTGLHVWRTNEVRHNAAVCRNCGLVVIPHESNNLVN